VFYSIQLHNNLGKVVHISLSSGSEVKTTSFRPLPLRVQQSEWFWAVLSAWVNVKLWHSRSLASAVSSMCPNRLRCRAWIVEVRRSWPLVRRTSALQKTGTIKCLTISTDTTGPKHWICIHQLWSLLACNCELTILRPHCAIKICIRTPIYYSFAVIVITSATTKPSSSSGCHSYS